jgi:site-specific recombinase XerD
VSIVVLCGKWAAEEDEAMGAFREAMLRDLEIRGYSPQTIDLYLRAMRDLVRFYMRPPDQLRPSDINRYQHWLTTERRISYSAFNVAVSAFRFFYTHTVPVTWKVSRVPYQRSPRRLPEILSREEVARIFAAVKNPKHRAMLMTIYAGGLRLGEALRLRVEDIDEGRRTLRVRRGKGAKDRYVPLSEVVVRELRPRLDEAARTDHLFPGKEPGKPLCDCTVQKAFNSAVRRADIQKRVSVHSLRHAFATHMLEGGAHIRAVQDILGHRSLGTTTIYVHCTDTYVRALRSPLDGLPAVPDGSAGGDPSTGG